MNPLTQEPRPVVWSPREQQAVEELGRTRFHRGTRATLIAVFLTLIVGTPIFDSVSDIRTNRRVRERMLAAGAAQSELPGRRPRFLDVLDALPSRRQLMTATTVKDVLSLLPRPEFLRAYETALSLNSPAGKLLRPWLQWALTAWLGTGSQTVLLGRDGWLFYHEGVSYVTGGGFLDRARLDVRSSGGRNDLDPRPAIFQLNDELRSLGVSLLLLPVPDKTVIRPRSLVGAGVADHSVQNASWNAFSAELRGGGVRLLDVTADLFEAEERGIPQFL